MNNCLIIIIGFKDFKAPPRRQVALVQQLASPSVCRQAGVNQLGGVFVNGRPLPLFIRCKIVEMARLGIRPCDISRQLLISHGCVSKILSRFNETGSISPGALDGNKKRIIPHLVSRIILQWKHEKPDVTVKEIRDYLLYYRIYVESNVPAGSSIEKILESDENFEKMSQTRLQSAINHGILVPR
uniref:Paired domain-containing protein n=1 Tax=Romanomermis culicivorax TaxID=13658 RepID=A0A915I4V0_ROMCU